MGNNLGRQTRNEWPVDPGDLDNKPLRGAHTGRRNKGWYWRLREEGSDHPNVFEDLVEFHSTVEDTYFEDDKDTSEEELHDRLLAELSEDERACIELKVFGGMSYRAVAEELGWYFGDPPLPDKKRAWRHTTRGLKKMREKLSA